jgi:RNA polymerase sigma-70 factor (ECF subfamily)
MTAQAEFDVFYAATSRRLVATVYALTGDLGEAEDSVQDAYAKAWQRWEWLTREGEGDPLPWVRTVAFRLAVSTWRRARGRLRAHLRHGLQRDVPELSADHVALVAALRGLTADQRHAIVLHHLLDLPVEEVARQCGVSNGTFVPGSAEPGRSSANGSPRLREEPPRPVPPSHPRGLTLMADIGKLLHDVARDAEPVVRLGQPGASRAAAGRRVAIAEQPLRLEGRPRILRDAPPARRFERNTQATAHGFCGDKPLLHDPPRRAGRVAADADGEVPAQETGEQDVRRYFKPSPEAIAELTSLLAPGDSRR